MDGRQTRTPITRTTTRGDVLALAVRPEDRAEQAARTVWLGALNGEKRPSRRWHNVADGTIRTAAVETRMIEDAALAGHPEHAMLRAAARAAVARVRALYAALRQQQPHLIAPDPTPRRRRTDRWAA